MAVGDSLTAGMQDMNLVGSRQEHSYPSMIAKALDVPFHQPNMSKKGIPPQFFLSPGASIAGSIWRYAQVALASTPALAGLALGLVPPDWTLWPMMHVGGMGRPADQGPFQNVAVPAFELRHLNSVSRPKQVMQEIADGVQGMGSLLALGPYSKYILQQGDKEGKTEIDRAIEQKPDLTFFWAGSNDILAAAQSGEVDDVRLTPMEDRVWSWESTNLFGKTKTHHSSKVMPGLKSSLVGPQGALTRLLAETDSEIAVMNIADVTVIPSLRKLGEPVGPLPFRILLPNGADVTKRIENWVLPSGVKGEGKEGRQEFPDGSSVSLMTMLSKFTHYFKVQTPQEFDSAISLMSEGRAAFDESEVLDPQEAGKIQSRVQEYNALISQACQENPRLHLIDTNGILTKAQKEGVALRGDGPDITVTNTFTALTDDRGYKGMFSSDGIHPSDVGYAVVANRILDQLKVELKDNPRFEDLQQAPVIDEKAALKEDPHAGELPVLVLTKFALDQIRGSSSS